MKTMNDLEAVIARSLDEYRETCKNLRDAIKTLETIYADTCTMTPADTVEPFVAAVGWDAAASVIATLVNSNSWDGRISRRAAHWAEEQPGCWSSDCAERMWLYTNRIHMAHLDQIAREMIKREIASFVAGAMYQSEGEPMTRDEAQVNIDNWTSDGVGFPTGMTAYELCTEWNRQIEEQRAAI